MYQLGQVAKEGKQELEQVYNIIIMTPSNCQYKIPHWMSKLKILTWIRVFMVNAQGP